MTVINLPEGVTVIGNEAFFQDNFRTIHIPSTVTTIGDKAFIYCNKLEEITIPESVTSMGTMVFLGCDKLKAVTVTPGSYAEQYCKANKIPYQYADSADWLGK